MSRPGHLLVLNTRLEELRRAIINRNWQDVEWEYDRVRRSVDKLEALLGPEAPTRPRGPTQGRDDKERPGRWPS